MVVSPLDVMRAAKQAKADHFLYLLDVYTRLVLIGVAIEGIEFAVEVGAWVVRKLRKRAELSDTKKANEFFPAVDRSIKEHKEFKAPTWVKFVAFVGLTLVVVGVRGELIFGDKLQVANNDIQTFDEAQLSDAQTKAEQLRKDAEMEHLARVKIEASVAWRELSFDQSKELCATLSPYRDRRSFVNFVDAESGEFADEIVKALQCAHIKVEGSPAWVQIQTMGKLPTGVIANEPGKANQPVAALFCRKLVEFGFACVVADPDTTPNPNAEPALDVRVDHRPRGPQGEFKLQAEAEAKARNSKSDSK